MSLALVDRYGKNHIASNHGSIALEQQERVGAFVVRVVGDQLDGLDVVRVDPLAPVLVSGQLGGDDAVERRQLRGAGDGSARGLQLPDTDVAARLREPQACLALLQLAVALRTPCRRAAARPGSA